MHKLTHSRPDLAMVTPQKLVLVFGLVFLPLLWCGAQAEPPAIDELLCLEAEDGCTINPRGVVEQCSKLLARSERLPAATRGDLLFTRGKAQFWLGNFAAARADFDSLCALRPDDASALAWRATVLAFLRRLDAAATDAAKATRRGPKLAQSWLALARVEVLKGHLDDAIRAANKAIALERGSPLAYFQRALAFWKKGEHEKCLADLDRCIQLSPLGALPEAADPYYLRGRVLLSLNRPKAALRNFLMVRVFDPSSSDAAWGIAVAYETLGRWHLTLEAAKAYIKLAPDSATAFALAAKASAHLHDEPGALDQVRQALRRAKPSDAATVAIAGDIYFILGRYKKARDCFDQALTIDPHCTAALAGKAAELATCPEAGYRDGHTALSLALKANADPAPPPEQKWYSAMIVAEAYAECGEFPKAVEWAKTALKLAGPSFAGRKDYERQLKLFQQKLPFRYGTDENGRGDLGNKGGALRNAK